MVYDKLMKVVKIEAHCYWNIGWSHIEGISLLSSKRIFKLKRKA
jgi:hypothetical protein